MIASVRCSAATGGWVAQTPSSQFTGRLILRSSSLSARGGRWIGAYLDEQGISFLSDAIAAATLRGVLVILFDPLGWEPARAAIATLRDAVSRTGDPSNLRSVRASADAPFAHLKVMVIDGVAAYVGSANVTAAGLAGRNLELGVLVRGSKVAVIEGLLDLYQLPEDR